MTVDGHIGRWRSTADQAEQVYALADEGLSLRAISKRVFGDKRYYLRVRRLLGARVPNDPDALDWLRNEYGGRE